MKRKSGLLRDHPLTFSPFGRLMTMSAASKRTRRDIQERRDDLPSSSANGFANHDNTKESDSSDNEDSEGVVQADFVFFDPKPSDFHGVKVLLQSYLDKKQWDLSGFVDLILGQPTVGTVVKIENDEDDGVYSVVSALNIGRYKDNKCIAELKDHLIKVCHDSNVINKLRTLLEDQAHDVGLIVSKRVVNLPPQLLPPLYDGLFDEVEWATEDEPTEELRNSFCFKFYLIICTIYKHKNADQIKGSNKKGEEPIVYAKPEDEIFHELSSWSFSFPLSTTHVTPNELKHYHSMGLVMAIEASKISSFREQLKSLIEE
ncbi:protein BCCIP homolog [Andrographis paniculata]|uniref:protein BCCIP homolog n=1 Tax=Andrographis paniculata TaxID=175694 RepID=UPI0021E8F1BA|nr:protein BCCIP homolog [Andrographis paniculata]XP_051148412.1 protein BCCIP homolog [Andrographis paniculata]